MRRWIGLSMLIVAVAGCGGADGGAAAAGVVPWAGRPAPPYASPEPRPLPYPASAPACGAGALAIGPTPTGAATGHLLDRPARPSLHAPVSPDTLRVDVSAPRSTRRGAVLRYVVTLANPTRTAVRLAPCPGYTEALDAVYLAGGRDHKADRRRRSS